MPYRMTPSVRHRAIEVHYYYYYYHKFGDLTKFLMGGILADLVGGFFNGDRPQ